MKNVKLTIEYDGKHFSGFQVQPGQRTVQGDIEAALKRITGKKTKITGCGRTDSGVHAANYVLSFKAKFTLSVSELKKALNGILRNIVIKNAQSVKSSFDARRSAKKREYVYLIYNGSNLPVLLDGKVCHTRKQLNIAKMQKASKLLIGRHDFSSFCAKDKIEKNCVREVKQLIVSNKEVEFFNDKYSLVEIKIIANSYLWKMVRFLSGTLIKVGIGSIDVSDMKRILKSRNNVNAGPVAPAHGLYLTRVWY